MTTTFKNSDHIYFIGIGGISMSGLAEILVNHGYHVSGSDIKDSSVTEHLRSIGIHINIGQNAENITNPITHVVFTAAIHDDNEELKTAKAKKLKVIDRAELLGQIMSEHSNSVAVSGTHGKTTTTSMVAEILLAAKKDPTITVGGILPTIGSNLKIGNSSYFVAEACEYHNSFLQLNPLVGIILNVESDHLDFFGSLENIYQSFHDFAKRIPENGVLIVNKDIENLSKITNGLTCRVETFSLTKEDANWTVKNTIHHDDGKNTFDIHFNHEIKATINLNVPGEHNISNAVAAIASTAFFGISPEDWTNGLGHFTGTNRRFQRKGEKNDIIVIDDYAHHPTEIKATLAAAKKVKHNKTWCIFQPHTYSRTKFLFDEFGDAFFDADEIIIADIYAAREIDDGTVNAKQLAERIKKTGKSAHYVGNFDEILSYLQNHCQKGDLLLTVGAGDVNKIGEAFLA